MLIRTTIPPMKTPKPKHRSPIRLFLGRIYFRIKKWIYWNFSKTKFATEISKKTLPHKIFGHKTLLLRKLQGVDMKLQKNKIKNLQIAIGNLDGLTIKPGEMFSYWKLIGNPTKRKGYIDGVILRSGRVYAGTGGGLCQLSNLIYWMTLHTSLKVAERWRHSFDVFPDSRRTQPFGSGATCSYPNIDLQIKNMTNQTFQLKLHLTKTHLVGEWFSSKPAKHAYEIVEKDHKIYQEWWGGYIRHNKLFRREKDTGKEQFIAENNAIMMYEPLIGNHQ